ncbi:DNA-directed RNA polymerase III subunit RPC7-like [Lutzomyia longipalpis]|uniref:DNA-directed RNA polymerase III subunit RPC7-like n=1 Tax=Lutzomyia longipalpis TaxID=7200 RepID=UPI002483C255|nr:DNA-directed RNA polymerase III subunit RPC7-like [Lutzomyia longipalpis]
MGGRGRGRGTSSFTHEQLQTLGCIGKDLQTIDRTLVPPPIFPMLPTKPVALDNSSERQYKVLWKEDFIGYLRDSPYFTKIKTPEQKVQRYSDAYIDALENPSKTRQKGEFLWDTMPPELRPSGKKLKREALTGTSLGAPKKAKAVDIVEKLNKLEKMEQVTEKTKIKQEPESDNENADEEEGDAEDYDEEMDDENDYGNSYFDNGEAFNEEDDNLDDGPVY